MRKLKAGQVRILIAVCIAVAMVLLYPWYQGQVQANNEETCGRFRQVVIWEFEHSLDAKLEAGDKPTTEELKDLIQQAIDTTEVSCTVEEDGNSLIVSGACKDGGTIVFTLTDTAYGAMEATCSVEGHEALHSSGHPDMQ